MATTPDAATSPGLDFLSFPIGGAITLGDVTLVRCDYRDKMKLYTDAGSKLMIVSQDSKKQSLVAINGDYKDGALMVDTNNTAAGFWLPQTAWEQLRPGAAIRVSDKLFIHYDLLDRITHMATESKQLQVVAGDYNGYQFMADEGDLSKGLLMVDGDNAAVGYWMPEDEYRTLSEQWMAQQAAQAAQQANQTAAQCEAKDATQPTGNASGTQPNGSPAK